MLEIAVAGALGPARASCPTVHAAACPTRYRRLSTGVTGSSPRSAPPGFGQIREPSFYVGLTHGVVSHSRPPPSRSSGGFMIPTTPCPPRCMWTCRTSTVCLLPRRTDIHHPTDNTLLWDVVRVVTRLVRRLGKLLKLQRIKGFRDRTRSARRRMYEIQRRTTRQRDEEQTGTYRELIGIAEEVVESARMALEKTSKTRGKDMLADMAIEEIRKDIEHYCGLGSQVIDQPRRRVLNGEQVPNAEKIYSIFEPHTDLIKRGKVRTPIEFGHKVFLAESAQGLITQYEVLKGNPSDEIHVAPSLDRHMEAFGRVPELYGSDRGFFSEQNIASCAREGVKVVCIPQRGGKKTPEREAYEKSADFKQGQRFRAGIEGRISVLFRGRGMKRCLAEGHERFELWVAAAVLANNLMNIAALLTRRASQTQSNLTT